MAGVDQQSGASEGTATPVFRDVLCAVDGTPGGFDSVAQAADLTGPAGHLTLLEVTSSGQAHGHPVIAVGPGRAKEILDRAVAIAVDAHVRTTVEVDPAAPPSQVILDWAAEHDLLAMGPPSTSWFSGMFTHGVADAALGALPTPLLVARTTKVESDFASHVLVASDGREGSDELVEFAARLAREREARVTLVHARASESGEREDRVHAQASRLKALLGDAADVLLMDGNARTEIIQAAHDLGASLVVMSSRRLGGVRAIGSISRRVVHGAHCSVLLLTPEFLRPEQPA